MEPDVTPPFGHALSRRRLLRRAALGAGALGGLAGGGLASASSGALGAADRTGPVFKVEEFGARGDGHRDDAVAIQAAIDAAAVDGGGVVLLAAGNYRVRAPLVLRRQTILQGVGWGLAEPSRGGDANQPGSWLRVTDAITSLLVPGRAAGIRDLGIRHTQPQPGIGAFTTIDYPFAVDVTGWDCWLENVMLLNPKRGIRAWGGGGFIERLNLRRIYGQPFDVGIEIDNMGDVMMLDELHLWPFWFDWTGIGPRTGLGEYALAHTVGVRSLRNDNPHFANVFVFGALAGMSFENSGGSDPSGPTSKFHLVNADFDSCVQGVQVLGSSTTGQIVNLSAQGPDPGGGAVGVYLRSRAAGSSIQLSNARLTLYQGNGIRVEAGRISIQNAWIEAWNQSGQGFPAIELAGGDQILLGATNWFDGGGGAPDTNL